MKTCSSTLTLVLAGTLATTTGLAQGTPQQRQQAEPAVTHQTAGFATVNESVALTAAPQFVAELSGNQADVEFAAGKTVTDELGMTHVTYEQSYRGIPVDGSRYIVHARNGQIETVSGQVVRIPPNLDVTPGLNANAALEAAVAELEITTPMWESASAPGGYDKPEGELTVFRHPRTGETKLAYRFDIYAAAPIYRAWVYTDATTGDVLFENSRIHHVDGVIPAESEYNGEVEVIADNRSDGTYALEQSTTGGGVYTFSLNNEVDPEVGIDYAAATSVVDDGLPFGADPASVSAHYGAEQTYDYYFTQHGRRSFNDEDSALISYTHALDGFVNAFWNGQVMTYGDGDGVNYGPLTSIDVSGHEITHGVTEYSANLLYFYESGALNESFSDIFGEMIEFHATGTGDWLVGADFTLGDTEPFRSMSDPQSLGYPDTYKGDNWISSDFDNGGVHINSSVQNYWFYLLSEGGEGENDYGDAYSIAPIGREKAAAISYRNLTVYLSENSTFRDARFTSIQSAVDLYGENSVEAQTVAEAWDAVAVDESAVPRACVDAGETVELELTTDAFATETSWNLTDTSGAVLYAGEGPFEPLTTYRDTFDLPAGQYIFNVFDSFGNGIAPSSYVLTSNGAPIKRGGTFGILDATKLCTSPEFDPDNVAPTPPDSFAASDITENSFTVSWSPSFDSVGVAGYTITYFGSEFLTVPDSVTSLDFADVPSGFEITFGLYAFDDQGNRSEEVFITFTTLGAGDLVELLTSPFETGYDGWVPGGWDAYRYRGPLSFDGDYSMRLRDNSGFFSSMFTYDTYDLTEYYNTELSFVFLTRSFEDGERFVIEYNDGDRSNNGAVGPAGPGFGAQELGDLKSAQRGDNPQASFGLGDVYDLFVGWEPIGVFTAGEDFINDEYFLAAAAVGAPEGGVLSEKSRFRIRCDASSNNDQVYIDEALLLGNVPDAAGQAPGTVPTLTKTGERSYSMGSRQPQEGLVQSVKALSSKPTFGVASGAKVKFTEDAKLLAYLSPNPAVNSVELELSKEVDIERATMYSATGQLVREVTPEEYEGSIDISSQAPGMYYVLLQLTEGESRTLRFVKQ